MSELEGKVAIVTGGAQGIGAAIVSGLEVAGATVVVADLNPPDGGIRADVASEEDVSAMVEETLEWNRVMEVNVASMFLTCRAVVPVMRKQGGGRIVNISSGTPFRGVPFLLHYVTSKGAIVALTRALAKELGRDSIHVNCVAPGFTMSDGVKSHPEVIEKLRDVSVASRTIQRDQVPEDVVGAVVFLCTPAADFITGQTMVIDGGQYFH
jgi:NAD(P)-dependent dehydrogenase (short-subunit alcohol dehydrogenase family)